MSLACRRVVVKLSAKPVVRLSAKAVLRLSAKVVFMLLDMSTGYS